jgi:pyruvyltransferase
MANLAWYVEPKGNIGDDLNPYLYKKITGNNPTFVDIRSSIQKYVAIGSILDHVGDNTEIWGSGILFSHAKINKTNIIPHAVRGKLTREVLLSSGIKCPEIYGDPALLLPKYYNPKIEIKYDLGIIPHYVDLASFNGFKSDNIKIISTRLDVESFVNNILSCNAVISSSLHGLIIADAYGIKNKWFILSNNVLGNGFKFRDYFSSVAIPNYQPIDFNQKINISNILNDIVDYNININLNKLMDVCPFK